MLVDTILSNKVRFQKPIRKLIVNMVETCLLTWCKHISKHWVNMSSKRRGIVKESRFELSVREGGREGISGLLRCLHT